MTPHRSPTISAHSLSPTDHQQARRGNRFAVRGHGIGAVLLLNALTAVGMHAVHASTGCSVEGMSQLTMNFETASPLIQSADGKGATGLEAVVTKCTAQTELPNRPDTVFGQLSIQYQGGDANDRIAQIVADPTKAGNSVLLFNLKRASVYDVENDQYKGRVQMNLYENKGIRQMRASVRMYLHPGMSRILTFPTKSEWLTIAEFWNNANWTKEKYPFRVNVNIVKDENLGRPRLLFKAQGQTYNPTARQWNPTPWAFTSTRFEIPVGEWITLEYWYVEGTASTGRFGMWATRRNGTRVNVFDMRAATRHPSDPSPDGLAHINPIKLYTSAELIDHVRNSGGEMTILWDDLRISACPDTRVNCPL